MKNNEQSVKEIKAAMETWAGALYNKDLDAMHQDYADTYRLFDVKETVSSIAKAKDLWKICFPFFDKPKIQYKDMEIHASSDMAIVHFRSRLTGMTHPMPEEMENTWLRGTVGFRKIDGKWKCIHEHFSFPFDCETMKIAASA